MPTDEHGQMIERRLRADRRETQTMFRNVERRKREAAITDLILDLRAANQRVLDACEIAKAA